ncbi:hypothetical protein [Haloarchaeobius amylolyticus]|uniref:hypothetical protein n=1 Tax=Haloarchaeobius amylolyticus TaxID=1198296 RepID=UPI00226DDC0D|nr:hypothetical protein [Haloarchaeobius amylolyticus]
MDRRFLVAAGGLLASLALSVFLWWRFETLAVFLFLPFVPFLFRRGGDTTDPDRRTCPRCGFETSDPRNEYCPRDGERLE